ADAHLTGTTLTRGSTWNAASHDLRLTFSNAVAVSSSFGGINNFTSDGTGGTVITGDFTTSGFQNYANAVTQSANAHLTGTLLTRGSTWNAAGNNLHLTFSSAVNLDPSLINVKDFTTDGAGGTTISGDFTTLGVQNYANAVTQTADSNLTGAALTLG